MTLRFEIRKLYEYIKKDRSAQSLFLANAVTAAIALWEGWSLITVMFIYWWQNVIIGLFNVCKILTYIGPVSKMPIQDSRPARVFLAGFFTVHYGLFHFAYLSFLRMDARSLDVKYLFVATIAFFLNHLFSFLYHFKEEGRDADLGKLFFFPYQRIIPMHITIIFGSFIMMLFRNFLAERAVLVFFLSLKTMVDLKMHSLAHAQGPFLRGYANT